MRNKKLFVLALILNFAVIFAKNEVNPILSNLNKLYALSQKDSSSWNKMADLCDLFGPRLSGSGNLANALNWILDKIKKDGFDTVYAEPVMVPKWVRIHQDCEMIEPWRKVMSISAYGGSVSTPSEGIFAEVFVVRSFDELFANKEKAKGRIVVFNPPYEGYGKTVMYRWLGAVRAAECGAVAALCRPITPMSLAKPHTGSMHYEDTIPKIPTASMTEEDVLLLQRLQDRGITPKLFLKIDTKDEGLVPSFNIIAEIRGKELPDEIIAFGGHIDSWDVGTGAQDAASCVIACWDALKLIEQANIKPRRTLRLVIWENEEFGLKGGQAYAEKHKNENHVLLFEFDSGVFPPKRIGFSGNETLWNKIKAFEPLLKPNFPALEIAKGGGGADISPMVRLGFPASSLNTEDSGRYFWYHHSEADTPDKVDPKDLNDCKAVIAMFLYLVSENL